jgi:hypothetical protein
MVDQMLEWLAGDGYAQAAHVREVRSCQSARLMHLGEEDFPSRTGGCAPAPDLPLQGPKLTVGKPTWILPL